VHFGLADLAVPFASSWKTGPVALGVVALYLLVAVEISSLYRTRLSRRAGKMIHLTSYVLFWSATLHLITAGTDAGNPVSRVAVAVTMTLVVFLTLVRALSGRGDRKRLSGDRSSRLHTTPRGAD
jgi:hypothetical protein